MAKSLNSRRARGGEVTRDLGCRALGQTGEAADAFAAELVAADVAHPESVPALERVATALAPASVGRAEVGQMMNRF